MNFPPSAELTALFRTELEGTAESLHVEIQRRDSRGRRRNPPRYARSTRRPDSAHRRARRRSPLRILCTSALCCLCALRPLLPLRPRRYFLGNSNTYSAWPSFGCLISGEIARGTCRGLPPPSPVVTAMYCLPSGGERHRESLHRRAEPRLPENLAGLHVERAEVAIEIADERDAAGRREHRREERRALLVAPELLHRSRRRRRRACRRCRPSPASRRSGDRRRCRRRLPSIRSSRPVHLHARLAERNDQRRGRRVVAHRLPVVAALGARARLDPLLDLLLDDVGAIGRHAGLRIDAIEDVLKDRFLVAEELAVACDRASTGCRPCRS